MAYRDSYVRDRQDRLQTLAMICWLAYAIGFLTSWVTGPIGFIIALVKRGEAEGTIYESHFAAVLRSGVICFLGYAIGWILVFTVIGAILGGPILVLTWLYNVYVVIRGFLRLSQRRPFD